VLRPYQNVLQRGGRRDPTHHTVTSCLHFITVGLIFQSAFPEKLEWDTRVADVALSLDAIKRFLSNMLVALDGDTPQTKKGLALPINFSTQESIINQEQPGLWFTLPELRFPLLTDKYRRPINPEIEKYTRRYVSNDQDLVYNKILCYLISCVVQLSSYATKWLFNTDMTCILGNMLPNL